MYTENISDRLPPFHRSDTHTHAELKLKYNTLEYDEPRKNTKIITFGEGTTEYVFMILSGYSSLILEINSVPIPDPVPPPKECVNWKPCKQSQLSASFL